MPLPRKSLGRGFVGDVETEKWLILVGIVLAWLIPVFVPAGTSRPTALGLPIWFLWALVFVVVEYALLYRLGSHYLSEPGAGPAAGGE